jgi:hypothetical protein
VHAIARAIAMLVLVSSCRTIDPPEPATLWLGGDVFLAYPARGRLAPLQGPGFVNLEGPLDPGGAVGASVGERVVLLHPPRALDVLREAGVAAVGLANNHRDDAGPDGRRYTREHVRAHGLLPVEEQGEVLVPSPGGPRVALTAHSLGEELPQGLQEDLLRARRSADALVATFHVQTEGHAPSQTLREAVQLAVQAGARAVAVSGSHELGRVERQGQAVVAYGLGNLLFDCTCTPSKDGLLLQLELFPDGSTGAAVVPVEAGLQGAPARTGVEAERVLDVLEGLGGAMLVRGEGRAVF